MSSSLLKMISPGDVSGLVTFTGDTVSSLMNTSCSSLRETIAVSGRLLKELRGAEAMDELEAVAADVSSLTLALEGVALEMLDGGETAPAGPKGDGEEEEEEEEAGAAVTSRRVRAVREGFLEKSSLNDYERLLIELDREDLCPVKMALGMSLAVSFQESAARSLLQAGLTVPDLVEMKYPREIIDVVVRTGVVMLSTL